MKEANKTDLAKSKNAEIAENSGADAQNESLDKLLGNASDEEADAPLQAEKIKEPINLMHKGVRKGKERTEKQKAATEKMKLAYALKQQQKKEQKALEEAQRKKELEEKVIKKAISIKKKQIKEQLALDEISDDDEPMDIIVPKMRKAAARKPATPAPAPAPQAPPKQKIVFI